MPMSRSKQKQTNSGAHTHMEQTNTHKSRVKTKPKTFASHKSIQNIRDGCVGRASRRRSTRRRRTLDHDWRASPSRVNKIDRERCVRTKKTPNNCYYFYYRSHWILLMRFLLCKRLWMQPRRTSAEYWESVHDSNHVFAFKVEFKLRYSLTFYLLVEKYQGFQERGSA